MEFTAPLERSLDAFINVLKLLLEAIVGDIPSAGEQHKPQAIRRYATLKFETLTKRCHSQQRRSGLTSLLLNHDSARFCLVLQER
jgi:hypothetical protein